MYVTTNNISAGDLFYEASLTQVYVTADNISAGSGMVAHGLNLEMVLDGLPSYLILDQTFSHLSSVSIPAWEGDLCKT